MRVSLALPMRSCATTLGAATPRVSLFPALLRGPTLRDFDGLSYKADRPESARN